MTSPGRWHKGFMSAQVELSVFSGLDAPANPWLELFTTPNYSILSLQGSHLHCEELYDQITDSHDGVLTTEAPLSGDSMRSKH